MPSEQPRNQVGLIGGATAIVIAAENVPDYLVKAVKLMKPYMGDLIQICESTSGNAEELQVSCNYIGSIGGGDVVAIGKFYIDETIATGNSDAGVIIKTSNTYLRGNKATILMGSGTNYNCVVALTSQVGDIEDVGISDLTITAPACGCDGLAIAVDVAGGGTSLKRVRVNNITISDIYYRAAGPSGGDGIGFGTGAIADLIEDVIIDGLIIKDCDKSGIESGHITGGAYAVRKVLISNFSISSPAGVSPEKHIRLNQYIADVVICNGVVEGGYDGYNLACSHSIVDNVKAIGCVSAGFYIDGDYLSFTNVYAKDCYDGFFISSDYNTFSAAHAYNNGRYGLWVTGDYNNLEGKSESNTQHGVYIGAGNSNNTIVWKSVSDGYNGILCNTSHHNNIKADVALAGRTGLTLSNCNYCNIQGNFHNNGQSANNTYGDVSVSSSTYTTVIGTVCIADEANKVYRHIGEDGTSDYNIIIGNTMKGAATTTGISITGEHSIIEDNIGFIAPGEIRTVAGALSPGNANDFSFAWQNPEAEKVIVLELMVEVETAGGTVGAVLDAGSASGATTHGDDLISGLGINSTGISVSTDRIKLDENGGAKDYITAQILTQNAASLDGSYYVQYMGARQ